jgi:hypothetical protein
VSVVDLIVVTWSSSGKIIKEMPGSVASGTRCIILLLAERQSIVEKL